MGKVIKVVTIPVDLDKALAEMQKDPESFLRHYMVTISGESHALSTLFPRAWFSMKATESDTRKGFQTGIRGMVGLPKDRPTLRITQLPGHKEAGSDEVVFEAWYIPMTDTSGVLSEWRHVVLEGTGGPDIALTVQMTGCTLGIGSAANNGSRYVAHVHPPPGQSNAQAYKTMRHDAALDKMDAFFERSSGGGAGGARHIGYSGAATVIGFRRDKQWSFYAQTYMLSDRKLPFKVERLV